MTYTFSTDDFTNAGKDDETGVTRFVTEASHMPRDLGRAFNLKSARTGRMVLFVHCRTVKDREGDVILWDYVPADSEVNSPPVRVYIYND